MTELATKVWLDTQSWKKNLDSMITHPVTPEDTSWDHFKPPLSLYVVTSFYVLSSLLLGPPLMRYRPALPFHAAFFVFNLVTLIVNFCLFMNSLVLFYSKSSLPIRLLTLLLDENGPVVVNLTWLHCAVKIFEFLGEALTILHHKHDNYRFLRVTYFLIQLTYVWMRLRFGASPFFSLTTLFNVIFDMVVLFYSSFEPSMHANCPKLKTKVERIICAMEICYLFVIMGHILPRPDGSNSSSDFSQSFTTYMCAFALATVAMLVVISWKADTVTRDRTTMMRQGRQSVVFEEYNFRPNPPVGEDDVVPVEDVDVPDDGE